MGALTDYHRFSRRGPRGRITNNKKYTLRETPSNLQRQDISLKRCTTKTTGFVPETFKIGTPTPGSQNNCDGLHFILEENIEKVIPPVNTNANYQDYYDDTEGGQCSNVCTSTIDQSEYDRVSRYAVDDAMFTANGDLERNTCYDGASTMSGI